MQHGAVFMRSDRSSRGDPDPSEVVELRATSELRGAASTKAAHLRGALEGHGGARPRRQQGGTKMANRLEGSDDLELINLELMNLGLGGIDLDPDGGGLDDELDLDGIGLDLDDAILLDPDRFGFEPPDFD